MSHAPAQVIDAHMHYGTDPAIAEHLTVPDLIYDDPDSLIATLLSAEE